MKKFALSFIALTLVVFALAGCAKPTPSLLTLTLDKNTAYFSASKQLMPISGSSPQAGDIFEEATIKVEASEAKRLQLVVEYDEGAEYIEGLKISVDGTVYDLKDEEIIFDSTDPITNKELLIKVFLSSTAPTSVGGKSLNFYFVLGAL